MAKTARGRQQQYERYLKVEKELDKRLAQNSKRRKEDRKPVERVKISPGDAEATLGLDKEKVYRPLYNVQLISDLHTDFLLAYEVFSGVPDAATLVPMVQRLDDCLEAWVRQMLLDAGYLTGANLRWAEGERLEPVGPYQENDWTAHKKGKKQIPKSEFVWQAATQTYRCPQGHELNYVRTQRRQRGEVEEKHQVYRCAPAHCQGCPRQSDCTRNAGAGRTVLRNEYEAEVERHRARMQAEPTRQLYRKRKEQIERRIADGKQHRQLRRLSLRGLAGARVQVGLLVLAHNLVLLAKRLRTQQAAPQPAVATP
jgi:hypothetical protein